jgi:hypothetical protein
MNNLWRLFRLPLALNGLLFLGWVLIEWRWGT